MMQGTSKMDIAKELLDSALYHYYDKKSYYASLHLAGAAEEILGAYVVKHDGESSFENLKQATVKIARLLNGDGTQPKERDVSKMMNLPKNSTKHMDAEEDDVVYFAAQEAAKDLLDRAITNYYHLMQYYPLDETSNISKFNADRT